jgi:hypothetical protein
MCVCNGLMRGRGNQARRCQYLDAVAHDYLALKDATWGSGYWWERANSDGREMHKILDWEGWERTEVESGRIGGSHGPTTGVSAAHGADGNGRGDWLR